MLKIHWYTLTALILVMISASDMLVVSEVKLVHPPLILLLSVLLLTDGSVRRIASLLRALWRAALPLPLLDHVVHDEDHGQVGGVGQRILLTIAHVNALFELLAGASAHTRLGTRQVLVHTDLVQGVGVDVIDSHLLLLRVILLHVLLLVLRAITAHDMLLLLKWALALASLGSRRVRHNALRLRDGLKSDSRGSCALTSHLVVVRHLLVELRGAGFG